MAIKTTLYTCVSDAVGHAASYPDSQTGPKHHKYPNSPGKADEPYPYPLQDPVPVDSPNANDVPVDEPAAPLRVDLENAAFISTKPRVSEFFSMTDRSSSGYIPQAV